METLVSLMESGMFSVIDLLLLAIIGMLIYFMVTKIHSNDKRVTACMEDEHKTVEKLSGIVYKLREEMEQEREEKWVLKEQISLLRIENERLRGTVEDLQKLVETLKEENARLIEQLRGEKE